MWTFPWFFSSDVLETVPDDSHEKVGDIDFFWVLLCLKLQKRMVLSEKLTLFNFSINLLVRFFWSYTWWQGSEVSPLSANFTKWSNTIKQFVGVDHFVGFALKGLGKSVSFECVKETHSRAKMGPTVFEPKIYIFELFSKSVH